MNKYTAQAETVDEAIQKALKELGIAKEEASIEIIDQGRKGIFKIGKKAQPINSRNELLHGFIHFRIGILSEKRVVGRGGGNPPFYKYFYCERYK
jgi:hypothetical protein